ncbi:MAG: ATP phosphoribosyltransferase [Alphaproteobacteria bacterium]|nr:ATP phosphoribosyltransferase [Alphaproteobacteria bacterium]
MNDRLRIAIQKNGRMAEGSIDLLKRCGLHISYGRNDLYCRVNELPVDLLLARDDDIPNFVQTGICEFGIVGDNVRREYALKNNLGDEPAAVMPLNFASCRLMIAAPENGHQMTLRELNGKRIATSHPGLLKEFLERNNMEAKIVSMRGSVELAPRLKLAEAICDLVSTGATLAANGLAPVTQVFTSGAVLIRTPGTLPAAKQAIYDRLAQRLQGALTAEQSKYIMLNAPKASVKAISALLPGCDAPTVIPLEGRDDMVALHAVCTKTVFWDMMERLKAAGASGILVVPIEKMMA